MSIGNWFLNVGEDPRVKPAGVRVAARLARISDDDGVIGVDENGRPLAEPRTIAAATGIGESSVFRALASLDDLGFIAWNKASVPERFTGVTGRVRLILQHEA